MTSLAAKLGALGKRKDREPSDVPRTQSTPKAEPRPPEAAAAQGKDNRLLAGLLAHEFLTRGTVFGKRWEPERGAEPGSAKPAYAEVSCLLKADGPHIPGVVNPTQLARWLQM